MQFSTILRVVSMGALAACALAVLVGRSAPRSSSRVPCVAHRSAFGPHFFAPRDRASWIIDTATGELSRLSLAGGDSLEWVSFSDWLDDQGERSVVGRWIASQGKTTRRVVGAVGLARFSYPSGRPLDRIADCPSPACAPCWYPGGEPRVLFASGGGRLFQCAFGKNGSKSATDPVAVEAVSWTHPPIAGHEPFVSHVVWPSGLNGCLIAALHPYSARGSASRQKLWWLRLSQDGNRVTAAGPLEADEPQGARFVEHCVPSVASLADGRHLIAYQRRHNREIVGALFVAPLEFDAQTGNPAIETTRAVKVADHVRGAPAAFSPDGSCVYAVQQPPGATPAVRRFSVEPAGR